MNGASNKFFASATFSRDEHGRAGGRDKLNLLKDFSQPMAFPDDIVEAAFLTNFFAQVVVLGSQARLLLLQ
jgi:hypothetical protein